MDNCMGNDDSYSLVHAISRLVTDRAKRGGEIYARMAARYGRFRAYFGGFFRHDVLHCQRGYHHHGGCGYRGFPLVAPACIPEFRCKQTAQCDLSHCRSGAGGGFPPPFGNETEGITHNRSSNSLPSICGEC
jgi:hypothetical protein